MMKPTITQTTVVAVSLSTLILICSFGTTTTTTLTVAANEITPNIADETCNGGSLPELWNANQTCIQYNGMTRCWYTYVPESLLLRLRNNSNNTTSDAAEPVPLVLDMHGYNLCAVYQSIYSGWNRIADNDDENNGGFIVVYPQGNMNAQYTANPCWSFGDCCCFTEEEDGSRSPVDTDDAGFLRQIVANVAADVAAVSDDTTTTTTPIRIDTRRLYFAGHSNGCMMSNAMAGLHSDLVTAVCCHSSSMRLNRTAANYAPTPIHVVYGNLDNSFDMFFDGDASVHILNVWGDMNGCDTDNVTTVVDDSGLYATHTLADCSGSTKVETVEVFNVGHWAYFGIPPENPWTVGNYPGAVTPEVDTTMLSWQFCKQYVSDTEPTLPEPVPTVDPDVFIMSSSQQQQQQQHPSSTTGPAEEEEEEEEETGDRDGEKTSTKGRDGDTSTANDKAMHWTTTSNAAVLALVMLL